MEESKVKIRFNIMAIILIIIFCVAISPITLQNDTFYTIKIGEYITGNGISELDPFSWHTGLKYTFPHWGYDVMISLIYNAGGFLGIYISTIILSAIFGIIMYLTNVKLTKNRVVSFVLTLGVIYLMKDYIAARAQLVTYVLFILTLFSIERFLATKKKRYAIGLVVIPIIIANIHVAVFPFYFILYLPYIGEYVAHYVANSNITACKMRIKRLNNKIKKTSDNGVIEELNNKVLGLEKRKEELLQRREKIDKNAYKIIINKNDNVKWLIVILIICLFTGLFTPLGMTPYTYLIKTMQGDTVNGISEHLPLVLMQNINFICVIIVFLAILMFTDTKIRLCDLLMLGGLLILTFYSRRQESMFIISCVYILNRLICAMFDKYDPEGCEKLEKIMVRRVGQITIIGIVLIMAIQVFKPKIGNTFVDENAYPVKAADYIVENLDMESMKLYNEYNYGSYLIYRGIPVFIDSRADLYASEFNPGVTVFNDFMDISNLGITNLQEKLDEYEITHLIMYSEAKLRIFLDSNEDKYELIYDDDSFCIYKTIYDEDLV